MYPLREKTVAAVAERMCHKDRLLSTRHASEIKQKECALLLLGNGMCTRTTCRGAESVAVTLFRWLDSPVW